MELSLEQLRAEHGHFKDLLRQTTRRKLRKNEEERRYLSISWMMPGMYITRLPLAVNGKIKLRHGKRDKKRNANWEVQRFLEG